MSIGMKNQSGASVPQPVAGETSVFIDAADDKFKRKKSDGTIVDIEATAAGVSSFNGRSGAVDPEAGDYTASEITNVPAGDIVSTTVQSAINELDSEKAPIAHVGSTGVSQHGVASGSVAGFMSPSDKTKLDGVASGATANDTDANLKNRANHTGTQTASTISDFDTEVDDRVDAGILSHVGESDPHAQYALDSDVTAAQSYAVQRSNHTGTQTSSTISDFVSSVKSTAVADLISNGVTDVAPSQNAVFDALANKSDVGHAHTSSEITDFVSASKAAVVDDAITNGVTDKAPSQNAVFDALASKLADPLTTRGDLLVRDATQTTRLARGATDYLLSVDGSGDLVWREENLGQDFGGGSDGDVTLSGVISLTNPAYYNNLTMVAGGAIVTNGYPLYVRGNLELSNCDVNCIRWNGGNGASTGTQAGGSGAAALTSVMMGGSTAGGAGSAGTTGAGAQAAAPTNATPANGGGGGAGGAGGSANAGGTAGGAARAGATTANSVEFDRFEQQFLRGAAVILGGGGGAGGSSGAGDGANNGRGGGGAGSGGGAMAVYCQTLITSVSTPAGAISVNGGNGGSCTGTAAGNAAGGGGAGGGGGGYAYLAYLEKQGPSVTNLIQANGGNGGNGGTGAGTGLGGNGGNGGSGGRIRVYNAKTATSVFAVGSAGSAGTAASGITGGSGGAGGVCQVSL